MHIIRKLILFVLSMQLIMDLTILLNIYIARQIIGFLYLTFVPGIIILYMIESDRLEFIEIVFFSAGLSICFLMITGLLMNELAYLFGILKPLSLVPLMIMLNLIVPFLCLLLTHRNIDLLSVDDAFSYKALLSFSLFLISIIGALLIIISPNNNIILLFMIVATAFLVILTLNSKFIPSKTYPFIILAIAIALLFHFSLSSNNLYGYDIQVEFFTFRLTENSSHWSSVIPNLDIDYSKTNSMLSVTILPTIFSNVLYIDGPWTLKIIYPLFFSFVPIGLYLLYRNIHKNEKVAFASVFFFMSYFIFYTEMLGLAKQMLAELFYVLLFNVIFNEKMGQKSKSVFFIIFSAALIISHYSMSFIFLYLLLCTAVLLFLAKKRNTSITAGIIMLLFVMQFSWYIYTSRSGPFTAFSMFLDTIHQSFLTEFFNPKSRGEDVLKAVGLEEAPTFIRTIGRFFAYITEFFILLGFILSLLNLIRHKKTSLKYDYIFVSALNMVLLFACIIVPYFSTGLNMTRFYQIQLLFLAPFCVLGGKTFFEFVFKDKNISFLLLSIVLITFFLFQTEFIYEITGSDSWSIPLSKYKMSIDRQKSQGVLNDQEIIGAEWLSENLPRYSSNIFAGQRYFTLCGGYGMLDRDEVQYFTNSTIVPTNSIIYLPRPGWLLEKYKIKEDNLTNFNKIYTNDDCLIYRNDG